MKKLDVTLNADEPLRVGLLRVADGLIQNATDRIKCPTSDHGEDVHLVRVNIKRLRALLRLIRPVISATAFDRENARLKKAARRLSLARDLDVARQTLATLPVSRGRGRDALATVLVGLNGNGNSEVEPRQAAKKVELELEQTRRAFFRIRLFEDEWKAVGPGLREVYRQCRKRMEIAFEHGDDKDFHRWRIRVKNLYYELQMLRPVWPKRLDKMVAGLRQLQDEIGADHDLVVLKRSLRKTPHAFGGDETVEQVVGSLDEKSKKLRRNAEPIGKAVFGQTARRFVRELGQHWSKWRRTK